MSADGAAQPVTVSLASILGLVAFAYVAVGATVPNPELESLDGGKRQLLTSEGTTVFVFFHPQQEHSRETLLGLAELQREMATTAVHWIGVVSDRFAAEAVRDALQAADIALPTLIDRGDALYGELGVRLYPSIGIADAEHRLLAYLPYARVHYLASVRAHLRHALGEIDDAELQAALEPSKVEWGGNGEAANSRLRLARMLLKAGKLEGALEQAQEAAELAPQQAKAHALVAAVYAAMGECDHAREHRERAIELDPDDESITELLAACP